MKFLKFDSEAACLDAFAPYLTEGFMPFYIGLAAVDVVGVVHKLTGEMNGELPEWVELPGWHVNLSEAVPELAAFEIPAPNTPSRVFA